MEDAKELSRLRHELLQLLNVRSVPTEQWRTICKNAGASSGILEDMNAGQLMAVMEAVRRVPTMKQGKKSA